jgi:hypothetical protein
MQSEAKATSRPPIALLSDPTSSRSEKAGFGLPSGRPKCDIRTTLAPFSISVSMVGASRSIRVASVTTPSLTGTFKSARSSTRLPRTSMSSRVRNLAMGLAPARLMRASLISINEGCSCFNVLAPTDQPRVTR